MKTLNQYIRENYKTKKAFAEAHNIKPQRITEMSEYIVVNGSVYSKRYNLIAVPKDSED